MTRRIRSLAVVLLLSWASVSTPVNALSDEIRGYQIDMSSLTPQQKSVITSSYLEQIKIIEGANLPKDMVDFFKTVPTIINPDIPKSGTQALYRRTKENPKGQVESSLRPIDADKPVFLHEMLHAYDANFWDFKNTFLLGSYNRAITEHLYSPKAEKSHFLENAREFFAVAGTIYLVGTIKQEPYDCKVIAAKQPKLVEFLEGLFGPKPHCRGL
jgi:hypothetical protein